MRIFLIIITGILSLSFNVKLDKNLNDQWYIYTYNFVQFFAHKCEEGVGSIEQTREERTSHEPRRRGATGEQRRGDEAREESREEARGETRGEAKRDERRATAKREETCGREARRTAARDEMHAEKRRVQKRARESERERKPCTKKTAHGGALYIKRRRLHLGASNAPHIKS